MAHTRENSRSITQHPGRTGGGARDIKGSLQSSSWSLWAQPTTQISFRCQAAFQLGECAPQEQRRWRSADALPTQAAPGSTRGAAQVSSFPLPQPGLSRFQGTRPSLPCRSKLVRTAALIFTVTKTKTPTPASQNYNYPHTHPPEEGDVSSHPRSLPGNTQRSHGTERAGPRRAERPG